MMKIVVWSRDVDSHLCNGDPDPDPSVHFNLNPDPDPDPDLTLMWIRIWSGFGSFSSSKWRESATTGLKTLHGSILSLYASVVSVHGPLWLHFEPLKLQNFDFSADPDPASQNNAVPDTQPWFKAFILIFLTPFSFETPDFRNESCRFAVQTI
jgi:hypothetical protein